MNIAIRQPGLAGDLPILVKSESGAVTTAQGTQANHGSVRVNKRCGLIRTWKQRVTGYLASIIDERSTAIISAKGSQVQETPE